MAKTKSITRTPATIAEMGAALHQMTQTSSKPSDNPETLNTLLYDAQSHYEQRIFWTLAQSPEDAIIQLARVNAELDAFDYEQEGYEQKWRRLNRDIDRALHSVVLWIERAHKMKRPEITDWYMADYMNPWDTLLAYMPPAEVG